MTCIKRMKSEMATMPQDDRITFTQENDNITNWTATLKGPIGTPYESGVFKLHIQVPNDYPFKPPQINFRTRIFHPNVSERGEICLDVLKSQWSPAFTLYKIMLAISSLLDDPNADSPLNSSAANLYKTDRNSYNAKVIEYVTNYCR